MLRIALQHLADGERELDADETRYLLRVHRLRTGDRCVAFDPTQRLEADLEVAATRSGWAKVRLENLRPCTRVAHIPVTLVQGIAKGGKTDAVVRDATELGATRIILAACARSVKRDVDLDRCRRVALDAARQSGRGDMPEIQGPLPFAEAIAIDSHDLRILLSPRAELSFGSLLLADDPPSLTLAVGPEGGFAAAECEVATAAGYVASRLGRFTLRTETACAAALGAFAARYASDQPPNN